MTKSIRSLRPGDPVPADPPRRYVSGKGYIRLRWKVGPGQYLETYEHRVVDGHVTTAEHVHHLNRDRTDNRPENLEFLTEAEHHDRHASPAIRRVIELYESGLSTVKVGAEVGMNPVAVLRLLRRNGVEVRNTWTYRGSPSVDDVRALHEQGVPVAQMARRLGFDRCAIERVMDANGLPRFPSGRKGASR